MLIDDLKTIIPFWNKLNNEEQSLIINNTKEVTYDRKSNVHGGRQECTGFIIVKQGLLRGYILGESGKELTLYRLTKGEMCILSASCILQNINFNILIDAETISQIYIINPKAIDQLRQNNVIVDKFLAELINQRFNDAMWLMEQLMFSKMEQRIALFLRKELELHQYMELKCTHDDIAKNIGTAREVVSRLLKYFQEENIINVSRGKIKILNKEKLINYK